MILRYSKNLPQQLFGVVFHSANRLSIFIVWATIVFMCHSQFSQHVDLAIPMVPISILGGALAIFLAFRNSSAYDRWWEARKIWGGIVNKSRNFGVQILTYSSSEYASDKLGNKELLDWRKRMIYRHIAWLYALKAHLRKEEMGDEVFKWFEKEESELLKTKTNVPVHILKMQGDNLNKGNEQLIFEQFRLFEMMHSVEEFYDLQGMVERIKNTVFPFYYNYFTRMFYWVFVLCLPFGLIEGMGWVTIPMSVAISFVFGILEKSGSVTEDPFEGRAADTPMQTICRAIEIDLREMLEDENIPEPLTKSIGKFKVEYQM